MARLAGKVALITGAASGIGKACACRFAHEGARVIAADIRECEETLAEISRESGFCRSELHDVTDESSWVKLIATLQSACGRLDVLVNNAGIVIAGALTETRLADWRRQHGVNADGVFLGMKHALPLMRAGGGGAIVNVSSTAALKGAAGLAAYAASKGSVRALSRSMALECANLKDGVRVNSIYPGVIATPIYDTLEGVPHQLAEESGKRPLARDPDALATAFVPLGMKGQPEDIAAAALYLASDEARYVTGAELVVDGGLSVA